MPHEAFKRGTLGSYASITGGRAFTLLKCNLCGETPPMKSNMPHQARTAGALPACGRGPFMRFSRYGEWETAKRSTGIATIAALPVATHANPKPRASHRIAVAPRFDTLRFVICGHTTTPTAAVASPYRSPTAPIPRHRLQLVSVSESGQWEVPSGDQRLRLHCEDAPR